jgi:hypothetical protein
MPLKAGAGRWSWGRGTARSRPAQRGGARSTYQLLARLLGTVGIKKVIVDFG